MATAFQLGEIIQRRRIASKMSARGLSLACGLSSSYVNKLESGDLEPSLAAFARIAVKLHLSYQEIAFIVLSEGSDETADEV